MLEDEALQLFETCSNVGRWGPDDELGTLNFIGPENRVAAAGLVRSGEVVPLGMVMSTRRSRKNPAPLVHRMLRASGDPPLAAADAFEITPHGFACTHLDAIGHVYFEGRAWNGRLAAEIVRADGLRFGSVLAAGNGIVTRGILLDVAAVRRVPWLAADETVTLADLAAAEHMAGLRVGRGDAVLVRVGLGAREQVEGEEDPEIRAGIGADCLEWLHEREVAVYGGDCVEQLPSPYPRLPLPLHQVGSVAMGLALLDCVDVEALAVACARAARWEFMLVCAPLRIPRATGSPVNPVAIL